MTFGRLDGKVAVVTGGGGLIGSAVAALLAQQGAAVAIVDIAAEPAAAVAEGIASSGASAVPFAADVADTDAVDLLFADLAARFQQIHIHVNCAAPLGLVPDERPLADLSLDVWDEMMRVALRGTMLCSRAAIPLLRDAGGGSIVNVSSIHALAGDSAVSAYPAAKAGIVALTRSIATQYGHHKVRCNVVCPGTIPSPTTSQSDVARRVRHQVIDRAGTPADVANAVVFLASDEASFITGGVLIHLPSYADGGNMQAPS
jgi:NAD(P)-dependent dehydrogenase (short-subunit alcohol dehydrogenase family)